MKMITENQIGIYLKKEIGSFVIAFVENPDRERKHLLTIEMTDNDLESLGNMIKKELESQPSNKEKI